MGYIRQGLSIAFILFFIHFWRDQKIILSLGNAAPLFSIKDQDGQIHNLLDYKGRKVIVYFFPMADTPG